MFKYLNTKIDAYKVLFTSEAIHFSFINNEKKMVLLPQNVATSDL